VLVSCFVVGVVGVVLDNKQTLKTPVLGELKLWKIKRLTSLFKD
jgi:hypothetical protein